MNDRRKQPRPCVIPFESLVSWAASKPTIKGLYVFGSYARGEATPESDLDLAVDVEGDDAELIAQNATWRAELEHLTGIRLDKIYHSNAVPVVSESTVLIYRRGTSET